MDMLLCVDIGNTNIKLGLFNGESLAARWRISTNRTLLSDEYAALLINLLNTENLHREEIDGCAISSVVPSLGQEWGLLARRYLHLEPLIVSPGLPTSMTIHTDNPSEVGPDLIVNALAARQLYGAPVIVIGFGTATTFSVVSAQGDFEGVAIAPGVGTGAEALFRFTAQLPQVALARPPRATGKNTVHSMQSGLIFGFAGLVEGLVKRLRQEWGEEARVVATGGLAELIANETAVIQAIEPDLTLIGLKMIYDFNKKEA